MPATYSTMKSAPCAWQAPTSDTSRRQSTLSTSVEPNDLVANRRSIRIDRIGYIMNEDKTMRAIARS
eukprot:2816438-Prymnesium_polylepis.1